VAARFNGRSRTPVSVAGFEETRAGRRGCGGRGSDVDAGTTVPSLLALHPARPNSLDGECASRCEVGAFDARVSGEYSTRP
jgi:hypothetical protein